MKSYYLKNIKSGMYFRTRLEKGWFHYVLRQDEATVLNKKEANKLLKELKYPENYEIIERREISGSRGVKTIK